MGGDHVVGGVRTFDPGSGLELRGGDEGAQHRLDLGVVVQEHLGEVGDERLGGVSETNRTASFRAILSAVFGW